MRFVVRMDGALPPPNPSASALRAFFREPPQLLRCAPIVVQILAGKSRVVTNGKLEVGVKWSFLLFLLLIPAIISRNALSRPYATRNTADRPKRAIKLDGPEPDLETALFDSPGVVAV
jgi:hypothetical protein